MAVAASAAVFLELGAQAEDNCWNTKAHDLPRSILAIDLHQTQPSMTR